MSGPSLAPILIPIVGTLSLIAWLLVVFHAGRHPSGTAPPRHPSGTAPPRRPAAGAVPAPRQPADASPGQRPAATPGGRA